MPLRVLSTLRHPAFLVAALALITIVAVIVGSERRNSELPESSALARSGGPGGPAILDPAALKVGAPLTAESGLVPLGAKTFEVGLSPAPNLPSSDRVAAEIPEVSAADSDVPLGQSPLNDEAGAQSTRNILDASASIHQYPSIGAVASRVQPGGSAAGGGNAGAGSSGGARGPGSSSNAPTFSPETLTETADEEVAAPPQGATTIAVSVTPPSRVRSTSFQPSQQGATDKPGAAPFDPNRPFGESDLLAPANQAPAGVAAANAALEVRLAQNVEQPAVPAPEPGTLILLGNGIAALLGTRALRRRRLRSQ